MCVPISDRTMWNVSKWYAQLEKEKKVIVVYIVRESTYFIILLPRVHAQNANLHGPSMLVRVVTDVFQTRGSCCSKNDRDRTRALSRSVSDLASTGASHY